MEFIIKKFKEKIWRLSWKKEMKQLSFTWNKVAELLKKGSFFHLFSVVVSALFSGRRRQLIRHECNEQKLRTGPYIITYR